MAQTASSYSIALVNDGAGNFTPAARRNPTQASGGTSLTVTPVENNNSGAASGAGVTTTLLPGVAIQACLRAIVNDIAAGN